MEIEEVYGPHRCMIPCKGGGWRMVTWEHTKWDYIEKFAPVRKRRLKNSFEGRWVLGLIAIVSIAHAATIIGPDSRAQIWLIIAAFAALFGCCWPWENRLDDSEKWRK
jgi:hypothetical protein